MTAYGAPLWSGAPICLVDMDGRDILSAMSRRAVFALVGVTGVLALSGCGGGVAGSASSGPPQTAAQAVSVEATFAPPPSAPAVTYDPKLVPPGAQVTVHAAADSGSTTVELAVRGLVPDRRYGAHAHAKPCGAKGEDAGPHFQSKVDPVQPSVDPAYANPQNEIWLDLTTDAQGAGTAKATVPWTFPADRRPHSVIVHAMPTATDAGKAGTAGARAACVTVDF